jgi:hypothetical protein
MTPKTRTRGEHAEKETARNSRRSSAAASQRERRGPALSARAPRRRAATPVLDGSMESLEIFFREARTHDLLTAAE